MLRAEVLALVALVAGCKQDAAAPAGGATTGAAAAADTVELTPAERAPLIRELQNGEPRLRHAIPAFSIHDPGPAFHELVPPSAVSKQMQPFNYWNQQSGTLLSISLVRGDDLTSEAQLRAYVDAEIEAVAGTDKTPAPRRTVNELTSTPGRVSAHVDLTIGDHGVHLGVYLFRRTGERPFVVSIMVIGNDEDAAPVVTSLMPE